VRINNERRRAAQQIVLGADAPFPMTVPLTLSQICVPVTFFESWKQLQMVMVRSCEFVYLQHTPLSQLACWRSPTWQPLVEPAAASKIATAYFVKPGIVA